MIKKDLTSSENIDRERKIEEHMDGHSVNTDHSEKANGSAETEVKNAHASGDGSFGRNETGVLDSNGKDEGEQIPESPY